MVVADPLEEYVVCAGVSFGLRIGDFLKISRGMLEPLLDQEIPIKLPPIQTKKKGVKAYPFIDKDCYLAIKRLLKVMGREEKNNLDYRMCSLTAFETNYLLFSCVMLWIGGLAVSVEIGYGNKFFLEN